MLMLRRQWPILLMLCSMLSVQGGASIAKQIFPALGPAGTTALRLGLAGLLLACINRPNIRKFNARDWFAAGVYGVCVGLMNLTFYYGIQRVPLGLGVTVEFIGPLGLALLTSRRCLDLLWAILAGVGIVLIVPWRGGQVDPLGLCFVFFAGLMWAGYIVFGGRLTRRMKSTDAVTVGLCIAMLFIVPWGFATGDLMNVTWPLMWLGLGVAVFSSALPFTLDMIVWHRIEPKTFSVLQSLQPAFGALSGLVFLGEALTAAQWLAIACVVCASGGAACFRESVKRD